MFVSLVDLKNFAKFLRLSKSLTIQPAQIFYILKT